MTAFWGSAPPRPALHPGKAVRMPTGGLATALTVHCVDSHTEGGRGQALRGAGKSLTPAFTPQGSIAFLLRARHYVTYLG